MQEFNHFDDLTQQLLKGMGQVVRKSAFDIQAAAASEAKVDTGNLRNSIYTKTSEGNGYPGKGSAHLVDDQVPDADEMTAYVAVGANYGLYVEMGTTHTPAHPYLMPAVEAARGPFEAAMGMLESKLKG